MLPIPIRRQDEEKYLDYEKTKIHKNRHVEKLPSNDFRIITTPSDFKMNGNYAHGKIKCSECNKPRIIYCKSKPSASEMKSFLNSLEDCNVTCGSLIDDNKRFWLNTKIHCHSRVETTYYSKFVDVIDGNMICYSCGKKCDDDSFEHIEEISENTFDVDFSKNLLSSIVKTEQQKLHLE